MKQYQYHTQNTTIISLYGRLAKLPTYLLPGSTGVDGVPTPELVSSEGCLGVLGLDSLAEPRREHCLGTSGTHLAWALYPQSVHFMPGEREVI